MGWVWGECDVDEGEDGAVGSVDEGCVIIINKMVKNLYDWEWGVTISSETRVYSVILIILERLENIHTIHNSIEQQSYLPVTVQPQHHHTYN